MSTSLLCVHLTVVGAGHPTEGAAGLWGNLHSPGTGPTQGHTFSRRPGQGLSKDQWPSSQISSHLWRLTLSWRQLGNREATARWKVGSWLPEQMLLQTDLYLPRARARTDAKGSGRAVRGVWAPCSPLLRACHL